MGICESGQGLTAAAISSRPFVWWASHRLPATEPQTFVGFFLQRTMAESPEKVDATSLAAGNPVEAYRVVARRYRPQRFDELVGQEHVARGLSGAIVSGRIGHAYLFTGARGVGKTSAARIYAKALACANGPAAEPCNACDNCVAISAGQDVDVLEVDAASNRGIDEIRQLRSNVAVRPARGRYKTYIIDEVHMLTREAFNALLKTLEEPPAHVKFVLCTTEPEKLPITILSRCQRFDFVTVDAPAIARRLLQIVEAEGAQASPAAIELIARRASGSMRDSQSLLEQLLGAAAGTIGVDDVHAIIGTGREEKVGRLVAAVGARNARQAIEAFDAAIEGGADPGGVLEQLLAALRDSLLASVGCGADAMLQGNGLGVDLIALGKSLSTETLLAMLQIIDQAIARMRLSGHAAVLAEMAIVRLATLENLESLAHAVERVAAAPTATHEPTGNAGSVRSAANPPLPTQAREKKTIEPSPPLAIDAAVAWRQASESMGGLAADFAATASAATWRDDVLEVVLPSAATTAIQFLRRPEVAAALVQALAAIMDRSVEYTIIIDTPVPAVAIPATHLPNTAQRTVGPASRVASDSLASAALIATPVSISQPQPIVSQTALLREAMEHPLVIHARTVFDAAVRKVEPPRPRGVPAVALDLQAEGSDTADTEVAESAGTVPSEMPKSLSSGTGGDHG